MTTAVSAERSTKSEDLRNVTGAGADAAGRGGA